MLFIYLSVIIFFTCKSCNVNNKSISLTSLSKQIEDINYLLIDNSISKKLEELNNKCDTRNESFADIVKQQIIHFSQLNVSTNSSSLNSSSINETTLL